MSNASATLEPGLPDRATRLDFFEAAITGTRNGVDITPRLKTLTVSEPPVRQAGIKVADVDELVGKLKALGIA